MSENICYADAYALQTDAVVLEIDLEANAVLLDRTVFYPGGGGQPPDTGDLGGVAGGSWRVTLDDATARSWCSTSSTSRRSSCPSWTRP